MPEGDLFRDTPVRFLGYANEVGEAFRSLVHVNAVHLSYGIASVYVLADTIDKSLKMYETPFADESTRNCRVMVAATDTLIWQAFASVIIPGFTINRVCALSLYALNKLNKFPPVTRKWVTTGIGLACIPFIVKPIDQFVDYSMNKTIRKIEGC